MCPVGGAFTGIVWQRACLSASDRSYGPSDRDFGGNAWDVYMIRRRRRGDVGVQTVRAACARVGRCVIEDCVPLGVPPQGRPGGNAVHGPHGAHGASPAVGVGSMGALDGAARSARVVGGARARAAGAARATRLTT